MIPDDSSLICPYNSSFYYNSDEDGITIHISQNLLVALSSTALVSLTSLASYVYNFFKKFKANHENQKEQLHVKDRKIQKLETDIGLLQIEKSDLINDNKNLCQKIDQLEKEKQNLIDDQIHPPIVPSSSGSDSFSVIDSSTPSLPHSTKQILGYKLKSVLNALKEKIPISSQKK